MMILSSDGQPMEKYLRHSVSGSMVSAYTSTRSGKKRIVSLPVCPKCERVGLRDKGWMEHKTMTCPHCGYHGVATHQLAAYMNEGLYK